MLPCGLSQVEQAYVQAPNARSINVEILAHFLDFEAYCCIHVAFAAEHENANTGVLCL